MKVLSIDLCGFRGCRGRLMLEFASGFTILTGSNGSGKSTILDAIDFALTGAISKYEDTSGEKGEKPSDYDWWRGDSHPPDRYVNLVLQGEGGERVEVRRRPGNVEVTGVPNLLGALCDLSLNPEGTIEGLCRTSFIRDESIASHSVDLPETDRFAFVRSAVGVQNTSHVQTKIQEAREEVGKRIEDARREYTIARTRVEESIERLSLRRAASPQTTAETVESSSIRHTMGLPEVATVSEVLRTAERAIAGLRSRVDILSRIFSRATSLQARLTSTEMDQLKKRKTEVENEIEVHRLSLQRTQQRIVESDQQYVKLRDGQEFISNLAELSKAGRHVGLREGSCPLCGLAIDADSFDKHLGEIEAEVSKFGSSIASAVELRAELRGIEAATKDQLGSSERAYDSIVAEIESMDRQITLLREEVVSAIPGATDWSPDVIRVELEQAMKHLSGLERERRLFSAPSDMREMLNHEQDIKMKREAALESERLLGRLQRVDDELKEGLDAVRRLSAEAVEERLAAIKPLFSELYLRLRPHVDWKRVDFAVRGDLRKFLSLRVDHGLNMKFLFSSGQRRAAGLAFLISVALSRPWCLLKTLILDDPIQHVDDFRAIHLVETLAAVRASGYQILCAVEDPNLAELLCRRLRSKYDEAGVLIKMKYVSGEGTQITENRPIPPLGIALLAAVS